MSQNRASEGREPERQRGGDARAALRGRFLVLDGVDGCGKSTQAARLVTHLREARGRQVLHLREPGSTGLGERLRAVLFDRELAIGAAAETLLFAAARRQLLDELVAPALERGCDVVCERFHASTFAYQAVAGQLTSDDVLALLRGWAESVSPDRTLILDLDPVLARARRGAPGDRIEDKDADYQARVADGYRAYLTHDPNARVVNADGSVDEVAERVVAAIDELFPAPLAEVAVVSVEERAADFGAGVFGQRPGGERDGR